jgi:pimeloyl-ACP methyl ester carboxylesterase
MKKWLALLLLLAAPAAAVAQSARTPKTAAAPVKYGSNPAAGHTFTHDGVRLYYEVYGTGEPLLLVHPNGGSISDLAAQIAWFRRRYRVIAMDSRDQGRSGDSNGKLTYEKMADDLAALLDTLKSGPVNVVGWSDGGIEALLLGMRHPASVKKIVSMSANLNPTDQALSPEVLGMIKSSVADLKSRATTPQARRELDTTAMMLEEPNVDMRELAKIQAPTLILSADHDLIVLSHTIDIYNHIPNGQLAIFPNALHTIPFDDPATFNGTVERFLRTPFVKRQSLDDTMKSMDRMRAPQPAR